MAAQALLLLLLLSCIPGDPDSTGRWPWHRASQYPGRLPPLAICQTHCLPEIIYWLWSTSAKELSGKAGREPQDSHSHERRRRREARALLRLPA